MKIIKSKFFWIIIIIILVGSSAIFIYGQQKKQPQYLTAKVEQGVLKQTVSATGKVQSVTETNLNFKNTGKLAEILVKQGDKVSKGKLLARLEAGKQASTVEDYRAQLLEAQANLDKVIAGASNEDIAVSQAKVEQAQADLFAKKNILTNLESERDQKILTLKEQALDSVTESIFYAEESMEDIYEFLYNDSNLNNLNVYYVSFNTAKNDYQAANISLTAIKSGEANYSTSSATTAIINFLEEVDDVLKEVQTALDSTYNLLSILSPLGNITQTIIDSNKTAVTADQDNITAAISEAQSAKADLQLKEVEYENDINEAEQDIEKAKTAWQVAQAELTLKQAGPRSFELEAAEAKVRMAEAKLQQAQVDLADYYLFSPLRGVVTKVNYEVGEFVSSVEPVVSLIGEGSLEIEVDVPESDIAKIKISDPAEITLDAFGEDRLFISHIIFVDPAETEINEVVYYKVKLVFDEQDKSIKSGMTANVVITTAKKENVLSIPLRAVVEQNGDKYVKVISNGQLSERKVQTGLRGDGGLIEITEGLTKGEEVITYVKNGK